MNCRRSCKFAQPPSRHTRVSRRIKGNLCIDAGCWRPKLFLTHKADPIVSNFNGIQFLDDFNQWLCRYLSSDLVLKPIHTILFELWRRFRDCNAAGFVGYRVPSRATYLHNDRKLSNYVRYIGGSRRPATPSNNNLNSDTEERVETWSCRRVRNSARFNRVADFGSKEHAWE